MTHPEQPQEESINKLIERFHPDIIFGFDPHPDFEEGLEKKSGTIIIKTQMAAWDRPGVLPIHINNTKTKVTGAGEQFDSYVMCFDLGAFIRMLPYNEELVLKIDAEGSEYILLQHIKNHSLDVAIDRILVEWHNGPADYELICPVEEWE